MLRDVTGEFEKHYGTERLTELFWTGKVSLDEDTGKYYAWEIKWSAADREGWSYIGDDFGSALSGLERKFGR